MNLNIFQAVGRIFYRTWTNFSDYTPITNKIGTDVTGIRDSDMLDVEKGIEKSNPRERKENHLIDYLKVALDEIEFVNWSDVPFNSTMKLTRALVEVLAEICANNNKLLAIYDQKKLSRLGISELDPSNGTIMLNPLLNYVKKRCFDKFHNSSTQKNEIHQHDVAALSESIRATCALYVHLCENEDLVPGIAFDLEKKYCFREDSEVLKPTELQFSDLLDSALRCLGIVTRFPGRCSCNCKVDFCYSYDCKFYIGQVGYVTLEFKSFGVTFNSLGENNIFSAGNQIFQSNKIFDAFVIVLPSQLEESHKIMTGDVPVKYVRQSVEHSLIGIVGKKGDKIIYGGRLTHYVDDSTDEKNFYFLNGSEKVSWGEWRGFEVLAAVYGV